MEQNVGVLKIAVRFVVRLSVHLSVVCVSFALCSFSKHEQMEL